MSPLQLEILLHYRGCAVDYRDGDFSAPAVRDAIDHFRDGVGLLKQNTENGLRRTYMLTDRAEAFLDHILALPLPEMVWVMPEAARRREGSE